MPHSKNNTVVRIAIMIVLTVVRILTINTTNSNIVCQRCSEIECPGPWLQAEASVGPQTERCISARLIER